MLLWVEQSIIAETNLVRLALAAEKIIDKSAETHDLINDCLVSASLLRQAREAAEQHMQSEPSRCPECDELTVYGTSCHNALCPSASR